MYETVIFNVTNSKVTASPCVASKNNFMSKNAANFGLFVAKFALTFCRLASMMEDKEVSPSAPTRKELAFSMDTDPGSNTMTIPEQRSFQVRIA